MGIEVMASISGDKISLPLSKDKMTKVSEEYRHYLDKLKAEFDDNYKKKIESAGQLADFCLLSTLGIGSFGRVVLAKHKTSNKHYAIKIMNKEKIIKEKQVDHTYNEKVVLQAIRFPFVIYMEFCFKDNCNIYFVLPFIPGGDMFTHLRRLRSFKEKDAKFYAAQVCLGLEYLHHLELIYRDLKPENIVIDMIGYIRIADFGFCKLVKQRTYTLCGTPEYIAPEIILSKGYGKSIDWWSFGVLLYEMIAGFTPFYADEPMKIYEKITSGRYKFTSDFSTDAKDLIRNILQIDLSRRYGNLKNGVLDIKGHAWFKIIDWQAIHNRKAIAPFVPKVKGPADTSNFDSFEDANVPASINEKYAKEFEDF